MSSTRTPTYILIGLLAFAAIGLLAGLYSGLLRLGLLSDLSTQPISPILHGPLMINGFLGTLIGLERAAALDKRWAFAAPLLLAASSALLLAGFTTIGQWLLVAGSVGLAAVMIYLYVLQPKVYHLIMALGAITLLVGNILYLWDWPIFELVGWWAAFPLLTIFGERLELNRIMRPPKRAQHFFTALNLLWIGSLVVVHFDRSLGWRISSVLLIAIALWLFKYDIAKRTVKAMEWTRYSAISLLSGYSWLVITGLLGFWQGFATAGPYYDGLLHMIFVGFVFSMIFAHASVIIPSLSGKLVPYHNYFYLPLMLLHGFLVIRITGDVMHWPGIRITGSYGNVLAIILFLGGIIFQLFFSKRKSLTENP
ncbi:hypothetical protein [Fodinibius halophilus]|uniref:NnrS family protein n=1 Tax=Fodinibius halophilus TaxID=1736908 RepID=A0A6M1TJ87_9BACT|nr:hypothetical protein [Fodinibius halophilus]NGP90122.1 hypothetical protein [Fodinibius halophilus]